MAKNFVSNQDVTIRLFKSDILEFFTRIHFTVPLILFGPVAAYFLYRSVATLGFSVADTAGWYLFGLAAWTLTEYVLHRFAFHYEPPGKVGQRIHFLAHGIHHDYPMDSWRLVMPPIITLPLAAMFYGLFLVIFGTHASPLFAGFLTGYVCYDLTHYAIHHFNMHSRLWLAIKNHHMRHHFQDPQRGFGVSSPLWDVICRTNFPSKEKNKSVVEEQTA
jgi:sterol desaturase/sphingolipid hydroxylase (fatty acid hydroxylase superfamily)